MSEQQYTTPEKPAGYRSYPENLRYYADHFDKYRMWADSGMTRAMRQSAEDVETLRARVTELEEWKREAEKQEPYEWLCISHDGYTRRRAGTRQSMEGFERWGYVCKPLYTRPLPAPVSVVPDDVVRLDFIISKGARVMSCQRDESPACYWLRWEEEEESEQHGSYPSPREAIDAAMRDSAMLAAKAKENK